MLTIVHGYMLSDSSMTPFECTLAAIDRANDADPNRVATPAGAVAKEHVYAQHMSARLASYCTGASDLLRLAVRAQHLCRWRILRSEYPSGRAAYRRWRTDLAAMHAELTVDIMTSCGYDTAATQRVANLIQKRNRATDAEAQILEDVACLVFLEHYLPAFAEKHDDAKLIIVVRKTWHKMSPLAHIAAQKLTLPERLQSILARALDT